MNHRRGSPVLAQRKQALIVRSAVLRGQCAAQARVLLAPACAWGDRAGQLLEVVKRHPWLTWGVGLGLLVWSLHGRRPGETGALRRVVGTWVLVRRWLPWGFALWRGLGAAQAVSADQGRAVARRASASPPA